MWAAGLKLSAGVRTDGQGRLPGELDRRAVKELVQQQIQELRPIRAPWYRSGPRHSSRGGWRSQHPQHQPQHQQQQQGAASGSFRSTTPSTTEVRGLLPCMHACMLPGPVMMLYISFIPHANMPPLRCLTLDCSTAVRQPVIGTKDCACACAWLGLTPLSDKSTQVVQPSGSGVGHAQASISEQVDLKTAGTGCFIPQREADDGVPRSTARAVPKHARHISSKGKEKAGAGACNPSL